MGSVRAYDKNINDWVVISTSDASSTSVRSEKLLPEGVSTTNVEEVLINMKDDKGNSKIEIEIRNGGHC